MIVLGLTAHLFFTSVSVALLLARGVYGAETNFKRGTSSPWFPSGPPPTKLPTETPEAVKKLLPRVTFDCKGKTGYFPDSKFDCEVFHYCKPDGTRNTFLCPTNSLFNQLSMVCEEKSALNSRICKEGSIGHKKEKLSPTKNSFKTNPKSSIKKKYAEEISKHHRTSSSPPFDNAKTSFRNNKALEELLSYGQHQPLAYGEDGFSYNGDLVKMSTSIAKSSKATPTKSSTSRTPAIATQKPSTPKYSKLESVTIGKEILEPSKSVVDDVSIEYDAIEGRKSRKLKRVGRVLDVESVPRLEPKATGKNRDAPSPVNRRVGRVLEAEVTRHQHKGKRSHVSVRSPSETPPPDDIMRSTTPSSTTKSTTLPSLFKSDRSKAKDFRSRRRNLNRRRKIPKNDETTTVANVELTEAPTTVQSVQQTKEETDEPSKYNYSRRKINSTRKISLDKDESLSWLGVSKSGKIEPYTLPPLPIPEDDQLETTTNTITKEEPVPQLKKRRPEKGGRTKNPWYKTTPIPGDDLAEIKFGEKISDMYHHHYANKQSDLTEDENKPEIKSNSPVPEHEDASDRHPFELDPPIHERKVRGRYRNAKKYIDNIDSAHYSVPSVSDKFKLTKIEDLFPPPRAESRELKSTQQHETQQLYTSAEKPIASSEERTTESPFKTTRSYIRKFRTKIRGQQDEGQRWKLNKERRKKIEVGSTFSLHTAAPDEENRSVLQMPTTTQSTVTNSVLSRKELPKTPSLAHQHLLKLMNQFFAMSSTTSKDMTGRTSKTIEEIRVTPNYRASDDDMLYGSESAKDEIEELPPELLEVVDLLADQSEEDKKEDKSDSSHEIIKISGPITKEHLKQILSADAFNGDSRQKKTRKESVKNIVLVPSENKENMKETAEVAKFASLKLEPFLKQIASDKTSMTVIPVTPNPPRRRQPAVLTAKKIPVRVIYKDQLSQSTIQSKPRKPNVKIVRSLLPRPSLQIIQNGKLSPTRSYSQPHPKQQQLLHARRPLVLQPQSLYPPHPPPLPKKTLPFKIGFPFVNGNRPMTNLRYPSHRRKRSVLNRDRRQLRPNPRFFPFPRPVFPTFNPKFVPTFTPFRNIFPPNGMNAASSNLNSLTFPRFEAPKPQANAVPSMFKPPNAPAPVRHITQHGDQTVIVEEVPVPIHVEVPDPNFLRPVHSGSPPKNFMNPFPNNQIRTPSPPALQTPPLLQGFQGRFPVNNGFRPFGMPSNVRPPVLNYQPSIQYSHPLPPSIANPQGQVFALGVTNKPFVPGKPPPVRIPNGIPGITGPPSLGPFQHFDIHANTYPNFPYFQGAFTTPLTNEPVPGRLMYSGYKPPKSTEGTKLPRTSPHPTKPITKNADRRPPRPKPTQAYYSPKSPVQEPRVNYNAHHSGIKPSFKPIVRGAPREITQLNQPRANYNTGSPVLIEEPVPRRRRPSRKRRPRPRTTAIPPTIQATNEISPTPPPPEQIPPPPSDYTSIPLHREVPNSLQNTQEASKVVETSSHYPPAGYYGKDQLGQFFDSSAKSYNKASTPTAYGYNDLGESTSSAEVEESIASVSSEDPDQPAFGTRLRSKPRSSQNRKRKRQPIQSSTERTETRVRSNNVQGEARSNNKRVSDNSNKMPIRNRERDENRNDEKRHRVLQHRSRSSPIRQPEVHQFNNANGFYNVPSGLQDLVAPERPPQTDGRSTDMFGIPHPVIDRSIYSIRPQGASGDFNSNFFSVPSEVSKQQQSPLLSMNIKPIPESAREFFETALKESSKVKEAESSEKKEPEQNAARSPTEESKPQRNPSIRKVKKPKRKNRINPPKNNEEKHSSDVTKDKPQAVQEQRNTISKERTTTPATTTTTEPRPAYIPKHNSTSQNDVKEPSPVFKQRAPLLPKTLPDLSKSLLNGKIDIKKLNATISTSVSVSGAFPQQTNNNTSSEENNKRVFSSQNGGLSVVRSNPRKKKPKQKQSTQTNDAFGSNDDSNAKYDIAASVLDIIKATTETEKQSAGFYSTRYDNSGNSSPKASNS